MTYQQTAAHLALDPPQHQPPPKTAARHPCTPATASRAEQHRMDLMRPHRQHAAAVASRDVPNASGAVLRPRDTPLAICGNHEAVDASSVACQLAAAGAGVKVPHPAAATAAPAMYQNGSSSAWQASDKTSTQTHTPERAGRHCCGCCHDCNHSHIKRNMQQLLLAAPTRPAAAHLAVPS